MLWGSEWKLLRTGQRETSQLYVIAAVRAKIHERTQQSLRSSPTTTHKDDSTRCPAATGTCRDTIGLHNTTVAAFIPFVFSLPSLTSSTTYIDLMASWWPILPGSTYCVGGPPLASDGIEAAPPGGKCTNKTHFNLNSSFRSNSPQLCVCDDKVIYFSFYQSRISQGNGRQ